MTHKKIQILATSDIHGYVMPTRFSADKNETLGLGKLATIIEKQREKAPSLLIENGDFIQGSPLTYYQYKKTSISENAMIKVANHLRYDAAVLGNHEFNYGHALVKQVAKEAHFPYIVANMVDDEGNVVFEPYIIKEIAKIKVAILGLTTQFIPVWEAPKHIKGWHFKSAVDTAQQWLPYIKEHEAPHLIVIAYHGGFENDLETGEKIETTGENEGYQLCEELEGVDIIITGHQHRLIQTKIHGKSVVQPGTKGTHLGCITVDITYDTTGEIVTLTHEPTLLPITETTSMNQEIERLHHEVYEATEQWLDEPIGHVIGSIQFEDAFRARVTEHPYVELINRIQMAVSGASISATSLFHDEPGGLPNEVTMRDIVTNYIYPNTLVVLRLTGQDIKDALEQCATYFELTEGGQLVVSSAFTYPKAEPYNYDMWEGITYAFDIRQPIGQRVVNVTYQHQPLDMTASYDVVMNNYRATGAGHFDMFKGKTVIKDIQMDMTEIIADYFIQHPIIEATCNHNWKIYY